MVIAEEINDVNLRPYEGFRWNFPTFTFLKWNMVSCCSCCCRYYSATILQMSGVRDDRLAIWLAGLTTLTNFLFTLLGVWLVERVGRRKLTLGSILGKPILNRRLKGKPLKCKCVFWCFFQQVHVWVWVFWPSVFSHLHSTVLPSRSTH